MKGSKLKIKAREKKSTLVDLKVTIVTHIVYGVDFVVKAQVYYAASI